MHNSPTIPDASPIQLRPTERDLENITLIKQANPEIATRSDLVRHALEITRRSIEREMQIAPTP